MVRVHQLSRRDARRIAVRAQLLDRPRPASMLDVVRHLTVVQAEPTAAIAPSADLVLWSRLGRAYRPAELAGALADQTLLELRGMIRPREDLSLFRAGMAGWADRPDLTEWEEDVREWVLANDECRRDILGLLETSGPLPTAALPDTCVVPWRSSGWNDDRNVRMLLDHMVLRGEVAVAGREGRDVVWDLADRVYPEDVVPEDEALRVRQQRRLAAMGVARSSRAENTAEPIDLTGVGEEAVVEGVRGTWRVDPEQVVGLARPFRGRAALLSPFDRLVQDRKRMTELFEFDYALEMFKPVAKRRWGYYALPILYGDRLVGKLDATADRREGVLRVHAVHEDVPFGAAMTTAVAGEIRSLADWLDMDVDHPS